MNYILLEEQGEEYSHYTTFENLYYILKDGYLKGNRYATNLKNLDYNCFANSDKEICVVRSDISHKINLDKLTNKNNLNVRIILKNNYIKNIRGIKSPKPIAEIPLNYYKDSNFAMSDLKRNGYDITNLKKMIDKDVSKEKLYREMSKINKFAETKSSEIQKSIKHDKFFILDNYINHLHFLKNREGEERYNVENAFDKKTNGNHSYYIKTQGIPVSSKYMTITINSTNISQELKEEIKEYNRKDPNLFKHTKEFNSITSYFNY